MAAYPIPLVPPYTLWLSAAEAITPSLHTALSAAVQPQGFEVKELRSATNPLVKAQAVFHDIRTLLREADSLTVLWSIAAGHSHSVIIGAVEIAGSNAGLGYATHGVPTHGTRFRLVTVHRHLLDDRPDIVERFHGCLQAVYGDVDIDLSEDRRHRLQAEADAFFAARLIPARVHIRNHVVEAASSPVLASDLAELSC